MPPNDVTQLLSVNSRGLVSRFLCVRSKSDYATILQVSFKYLEKILFTLGNVYWFTIKVATPIAIKMMLALPHVLIGSKSTLYPRRLLAI